MKNMKKIFALVLALLMIVGMTAALAATPTGDHYIKIGNSTNGNTYDAYKVFDVTYNSDKTAYSYTISSNSPFYTTIVNSNLFTLAQIGNTGVYNVTATTMTGASGTTSPTAAQGTAGSTLAPALKAVVDAFSAAQKTAALAGSATATSDNQEDLYINLTEDGYYFVTTTTGSLCSLDTSNPNVTINDKNSKPTIEKEVKEDSTGTWGETNDGEIGETVNFQTFIHAQPGATGYVLHDKMDDGLAWTGASDVTVYIQDNAYEGSDKVVIGTGADAKTFKPVTAGTGTWAVAAGSENGDPCDFHVTFVDAWLAENITAAKDILVRYNATITSNAVHADPENNDTWLKYGENNTTEHDYTKTYVWDFNLYKYANGHEDTPLDGAHFRIVNGDKTKAAIITNGKLAGWVDLANGDNADNGVVTVGTDLVTPASGKISVDGFDAGTYYLVETEAPAGYNKLTAPITVTITSSETGDTNSKTRTYTVTNAAVIADQKDTNGQALATTSPDYDAKLYLKANNQSGTELPSTGGIGTTIFYVAGGILVLAAVILLVTKRRMGAND